jgi:HK97 family phage portal protein
VLKYLERIRSQFGEKYKGLANSKKPILLEGGMKWQPITISNNDSQFLETRQFQKSEIASIFRVSPHLINDLSKATFSNITELSQEHVKYCLMPLGVKIESAINIQLLTKQEQKKYYCELNYDGMLRGNFKERSEGYKEAINAGWMKPNEVRRKENLPTEEFGDKLIMQMQYTTLENIENGDSNETITE